jgi:hypothetical protein
MKICKSKNLPPEAGKYVGLLGENDLLAEWERLAALLKEGEAISRDRKRLAEVTAELLKIQAAKELL